MRVTNCWLLRDPYRVLNSLEEANELAIRLRLHSPARCRATQNARPDASGARARKARYSRAVGSTWVVLSVPRRISVTRSPLVFVPAWRAADQVLRSVEDGAAAVRSTERRVTR